MSESRRDGPPRGVVKGAAAGVGLVLDGMRVLAADRGLWLLAAVPVAFTFAALATTLVLIVEYYEAIRLLLTGWLPVLEAGAWYAWLWVGPGKLLLFVFGFLLFALFSGVCLVLAFLIANLLSSPFLDVLSQRVERIASGEFFDSGDSGLAAVFAEAGRSLVNESRRIAFFGALWLLIFAAGLLIPGGQLVAPPLLLCLTALFLPLDYAGYALDRRHIPFHTRRSWLREHLPVMAGFGGTAFLTGLVPGLNLLMLPCLVTAGTLLVLRYPISDPISDPIPAPPPASGEVGG
ncbi:MAG: EI24 domain-containing protein [Deltaproteobacteria bacterium]|nr:EI24 domain-containing protein [Deltaproteobacteria bacterium]MBW2417025.1 EI24 domain-containing protein [Deltaproteobacteria bacterium]